MVSWLPGRSCLTTTLPRRDQNKISTSSRILPLQPILTLSRTTRSSPRAHRWFLSPPPGPALCLPSQSSSLHCLLPVLPRAVHGVDQVSPLPLDHLLPVLLPGAVCGVGPLPPPLSHLYFCLCRLFSELRPGQSGANNIFGRGNLPPRGASGNSGRILNCPVS